MNSPRRQAPCRPRATDALLRGIYGFAVNAVPRTLGNARRIDGSASTRRPLKVGEIVTAKIERADAYDLHGSGVGF
jgi:hypothetical protein